MNNLEVKNVRFEQISSSLKGYKEIRVVFDYKGKTNGYFIFIEERKNTNYIKQAKQEFYRDLKSGKVIKSLKASSTTSSRSWLTIGGIASAAAIVLASLFTWKYVANTQPESEEGEAAYHTVTFMDDDNLIKQVKVPHGETCPKPAESITHGLFTLINWTISQDIPEGFDFTTPIVEDITLHSNMRIILNRFDDDYMAYMAYINPEIFKETAAYYPDDKIMKFCLDLSKMPDGKRYDGMCLGARGGYQPYAWLSTLWVGNKKLINGVDYIEDGQEAIRWIHPVTKTNSTFYVDFNPEYSSQSTGSVGDLKKLFQMLPDIDVYYSCSVQDI